MEKETLQCHKEYSANTRKQVSALKAEALRAHASMVSSTEKQKLKILYVVFEREARELTFSRFHQNDNCITSYHLYHSFTSEENHSNTQRSNAHSNVT